MTKAQRKRFDAVADALNDLEALANEMRETLEEQSERWQESDKGVAFTEEVCAIEEYVSDLLDIQTPVL